MNIVDGKKISSKILSDLKLRVSSLKNLGIIPSLAVVLIGDDKASHTYVSKKEEAAKDVGINFIRIELPASISKEELSQQILKAQKDNHLEGMIVQFPLPEHLWECRRDITDNISLDIDVDCLSRTALGRVLVGESKFVPPTPGAIMEILKHYSVDLMGKHICIVGRGDLIGKPLAAMLMNYPVTITVCGRSTKNLSDILKQADVIVTGVGKGNLITEDMVNDGSIVIDAGVSFDDHGKMVGDVDFESVKNKASLITPVPGGVGPITVAKLLENVVLASESRTL